MKKLIMFRIKMLIPFRALLILLKFKFSFRNFSETLKATSPIDLASFVLVSVRLIGTQCSLTDSANVF